MQTGVMDCALLPGLHASGVSYTSEALAIFGTMLIKPTDARKGIIDTFIRSLKVAGVWPLLDCYYNFAAADSQTALLNWVNPTGAYNAIAINSPNFLADRGFQGDGVASYLETSFNPATAGGKYTQSLAHVSARSLTPLSAGANKERIVGAHASTTARLILAPWNASNQTMAWINSAAGSSPASSSALGHWLVTRSGSPWALYKNGASIATGSAATNGLPNTTINFGREIANFCSLRIASGSIGAALTAPQAAALYAAEHAYMQALGAVA